MSDRGELSFREAPDFETPRDAGQDNEYALEVVATDGEGLRGTLEITVTVTELNEGPVVSGTATFTVNENQDLTGATYTASDPEATGGVTTTITWSTAGRDGGDFIIDRETGVHLHSAHCPTTSGLPIRTGTTSMRSPCAPTTAGTTALST